MKAVLAALSLFAFTGLASANINVSGNGKVIYVPDVGYVTVGVVGEGKTAAEAWEKNRLKVEKIFEALKKLGLEPRDMQTSGLNISPKYLTRPNHQPELIGYTVSYDLKVTVRKLDHMGEVLDQIVQAGANRNMNISFGCSDYDKLLDEARAKAVADARKKATIYSTGAGARLGKVLKISEQSYYAPRSFTYEHAQLVPGDKSLPIAVGEQEMSVQIFLEYELLEEFEGK
jgi:uncharacterized protein YggE